MSTPTPAAWTALLLAHGRVTDRVDRDLVETCGMTLAEYEVIDHLAGARGHVLRMNELADLVRLSPSGLTRRFDTLVRRRWVAREPCSDDRRGINARLTAEGESAHTSARSVHNEGVTQYLLAHLDEEQLACLLNALGSVAEANAHDTARRRDPAQRVLG